MTVVINTPVNQRGRYDNSPHVEDYLISQTDNQAYLGAVLGTPKRYHYLSRRSVNIVQSTDRNHGRYRNHADYCIPTTSLGIQVIHQAFAAHVPLSLSPDLLWYMIVHEVAEHVRQNSGLYANLFTDDPANKQLIEVRDDSLSYDRPSDWLSAIDLFREPLRKQLTEQTVDLFLPDFTTTTIADEITLLVALMDVVSPYYDYQMATMCGIPQIRLEGDVSDWELLLSKIEKLAPPFTGLTGYFIDLVNVLRKIVATVAHPNNINVNFWRSIYKYMNASGGPRVTGWISAFFAHVQTKNGPQLKQKFDWRRQSFSTNEYPSHLSQVPFIWDCLGRKIPMTIAAGVIGVDFVDDTFLAPKLGFVVAEVCPI
jgi:hypothetical protein